MKVTCKSLAFDITNIYRNVQNPVWAFVVFQTNRFNNQQNDNTFGRADVKNLWLELGGKLYPEKSLDLDWDNDHYCLAYDAFQDYKKSFVKAADSIPYISKKDFINLFQFIALIYKINHKKYQT